MNYRKNIFDQIDSIVTFGNGYDYATVHEMPVWLRNYTFNKIKERIEKDQKNIDEQLNEVKKLQNKNTKKFNPSKMKY